MAKEDMKKESPKTKKPISPKAEKPNGFKTVVFNYVGRNIHCIDKQFASYVNDKVANIYKKKNSKMIESVE